MADPYAVEGSVADQWGLTPNPPPANGQPLPASTPAPQFNISESQRWGTEQMPGQQPRPAPYALDTSPPPVPAGPLGQQSVDDAREFDRNRQEEIEAYKRPLSVLDWSELPAAYSREQHPEWSKLQTAKEMAANITNPKERVQADRLVNQLERRINNEAKAQDQDRARVRREQLANKDAPFTSPEARQKTAEVMNSAVGTVMNNTFGNLTSRDPALARQSDYDLMTSPIMTMSIPKPGSDPKAKPAADNRDFTPFVEAATSIAVHNRNLPNEKAARAVMIMASPGGGTDEQGKQQPGFNGRTGSGATNYKVLGRDDLGNVMVQLVDGTRLRVPGETFRNLSTARQQGVQRARTWETEYKKSQEPGMIRRAVNWGLSVIPEKGF